MVLEMMMKNSNRIDLFEPVKYSEQFPEIERPVRSFRPLTIRHEFLTDKRIPRPHPHHL